MSGSDLEQLQNEIGRLKSAIQELTVLNDLAIAASSSLEVEQVLDIIVEKSIRAVHAEQGSILLVTEQQDAPLKTLIRQEDRRSRLFTYRVGTNITGWVLKHKQPLKIDNLSKDERFKTTEQERKLIKSVLCLPIQFRGQLLGLLMVTNKTTLEPFSDGDLRLLSIIAAQSGQLIRNSQLQQETLEKKRMEHELAMARKIQRGLLPTAAPEIEGIDIASYFNAADEVSGDYYDYFDLGEKRVGVAMADVSGHGTSSALMMTMVKGILHAMAQEFQSPEHLLAETNLILEHIMPKEMFVTMMFLVFDLETKTLCYSNAGHNPLLVCSGKNGQCEFIELRGPALGITSLARYQQKQIPLHPGDLFVIYTDGVTEAFNLQKEMFEESRLIEAVAASARAPADEVIMHIKTRLDEFTTGAMQSDDVAMIAMKIT